MADPTVGDGDGALRTMPSRGRQRKGVEVSGHLLLLDERRIRRIRGALLAFYDRARRDLPWRRTSDPYRIWVSEVMLQQTRVEAVIGFYERWLALFPTVEALADAPEDAVLKAWEGLGYYSRARNLHRAACFVRERHGGRLPADPSALRRLPGIGDYTAGAIASIAFGRAEPAVDGNVRRVLARLLDDPDPSPVLLREVAGELVPRRRAGDFNQALMELGATICTPRSPSCAECPVAQWCASRQAGTQQDRPVRRTRRAVPVYDIGTAVVLDRNNRVLLGRRPDGMLAGLLSFPGAVIAPGEDAGSAARRAVPFDVDPAGDGLGEIEHTFTHRRERYHAVRFRIGGAILPAHSPDFRWIAIDDLGAIAMPVAQRRIATLALHER